MRTLSLAVMALALTACAEHSFRETVVPPIMRADYIGDVAETEVRYATKRCNGDRHSAGHGGMERVPAGERRGTVGH